MSKTSLAIAACVALLASSTGLAAFTVSPVGNAVVTDLGSFQVGDTRVNRLTNGNYGTMVVSDTLTAPASWADLNEFTSLLQGGTYQVFLVDGYRGSANGNSSVDFSITFEGLAVAGIVASNGFNLNGAFNVWGALSDVNLLAEISTAVTASVLTELQSTTSNRAMDIINGPNSQNPQAATNPDAAVVSLNGNVLTYSVNATEFGRDYSLVFASVLAPIPEPTTFAIWGLCGVGAVVAGRRRMRRLAV